MQLLTIHRIRHIAWEKCPYRVADKASALLGRGKMGARTNAHTELRTKRSLREVIYQNRPIVSSQLNLSVFVYAVRLTVSALLGGRTATGPSAPSTGALCSIKTWQSRSCMPRGRGLHLSTFRLNVSAFCGIWGALTVCLGVVYGVSGGARGYLGCISVSEMVQVELKSGTV